MTDTHQSTTEIDEPTDGVTVEQDAESGVTGDPTAAQAGGSSHEPSATESIDADDEVGSTVEATDGGERAGNLDPADDGDVDHEDEAVKDPDGSAQVGGPVAKSRRVGQLEREGEVAADFLETLLDIADLDGDIEVDIDGDRAAVSVVDSEEGRVPRRLVGQQGKVLEALQELTRLAVQTATGERSRLMLDVAGHRAERRTALVAVAREAIAEVKSSGGKKALDDMTAFERKVIHDEVAAAGLDSESEGVEPHRHIVILPA